jgi:hypothetical protein
MHRQRRESDKALDLRKRCSESPPFNLAQKREWSAEEELTPALQVLGVRRSKRLKYCLELGLARGVQSIPSAH